MLGQYPVDRLIRELADTGGVATAADVMPISDRVTTAPFATYVVTMAWNLPTAKRGE